MSPKQYIQGERIKLAQKLLLGSTYSVSEITERCGYLSESTFCRVFKQKNGVTPTEYRKENKRYFV
jgi:two-component system response regulator YesN